MRIKSIFSTQAANIIVELFDQQDVSRVLNEWKHHFFSSLGTEGSGEFAGKQGTLVVHMSKSSKQTEVVIKHVPKSFTDDDIKSELQSPHNQFTSPKVRRFIKRGGEVLNTIKVDFDSHDDFIKATRMGIFLHGEHFNAEAYIHQPKAHQCYKCKNFGHPSKWCTRKLGCEYCAEEGHAGKECFSRGELHEYHCSNCSGPHASTYSKCPEYIKHIRSTVSIQYSGYD